MLNVTFVIFLLINETMSIVGGRQQAAESSRCGRGWLRPGDSATAVAIDRKTIVWFSFNVGPAAQH